jgi:heat shock protein 4
MICKLKARLNVHGILNVESGYYVEEVEVEEPIPEEKKEGDVRISPPSSAYLDPRYDSVDTSSEQQSDDSPEERAVKRRKSNAKIVSQASVSLPVEKALTKPSQAMDVDSKESKEPPKMRKVKKQQRKGDLPISSGTATLDQSNKEAAAEKENEMIMEDKLVADTEHQKNDLESFIYELKDKILDVYAEFANEDEKSRLSAKLEQTEVSYIQPRHPGRTKLS